MYIISFLWRFSILIQPVTLFLVYNISRCSLSALYDHAITYILVGVTVGGIVDPTTVLLLLKNEYSQVHTYSIASFIYSFALSPKLAM